MQPKPLNTITLVKALACAVLMLGFGAQAADKNVDPTGKWTWSRPGRDGGQARTTTLTLKMEGEKLTGKLSTPGRQGGDPRETEIKMGKVTGNEISFVVTREFNGNEFTTKYTGKIEGDALKGTMAFERNGEARTREWEAKRVKAAE